MRASDKIHATAFIMAMSLCTSRMGHRIRPARMILMYICPVYLIMLPV